MTNLASQKERPRTRGVMTSANGACRFGASLAMALALTSLPALATPTLHNISAGYIQLTNTPGDDSVTISSLPYSFNQFQLLSATKGTAQVQIGTDVSDDQANGILLSAIPINITTNYGTNNYAISMIETNANGGYHIAVYKSGSENAKENCDVVGAYFPYSSWIGGHFRTDPYLNGGTNTLFTGTPGLVVGVNIVDLRSTLNLGGRTLVNLTNLGINSQTDGILIVNHGKDRSGDGNYAVSYANPDGTWNVWVRDHGGNSEQDPMAFVYIPRTNTTVISGRFKGTDDDNNLILMYSGDSPAFNVQNIGSGRWHLTIPGYGPTNGVLLLSGEGGASQNPDNDVTYQALPDNSGWEIQSRDLPGGGLQTPDNGVDPICDFVFIPGPTPGITVTPTNNLQTTENGGTATFTVALDTKPTAPVTINIASSDTTEGTVSVSSVVFVPSTWNIPQTVTVTGVDDPDQDGSVPYNIVLSPAISDDPVYSGRDPADVTIVNVDNEPGITFSKLGLTTTEAGGSDTFTAVLNTPPTGDVTFNLSSSNTGEGTVSPTTLTFTAGNWNVPQTVTVTGVDDQVADGNIAYSIITSAATSSDANYNGRDPIDLNAVNVDNDTAGFNFSASSLTVLEGGSSTNFSVALTSQPTGNVTVNFASSDTTEGTVTPSVSFTPSNWSTPQNVTLTPVDDNTSDGDISYTINVTVSSSDSVYAALTASINATTLDNEADLTLPSGTLYYGIGDPAIGIDGQAAINDPDSANYNSGSLTVTLTANASSDDRLAVRNDGTDPGEIGVSGTTVSYGGTAIGTVSGGTGSSPLVVSLNANATPEAAQALLRAVTFQNVDTSSSAITTRTVSIVLADGAGGTSSASKQIVLSLVHVVEFQDGVDHGYGSYAGEKDLELWDLNPDSSWPAGSDPVNGLQITTIDDQVLLRFDNLVGTGPGQIPPGATIVSADLQLDVNVSGVGSPLYQMLLPWNEEFDTYNSWGAGVDQDNVESTNVYYSQLGSEPVSGGTTVGTIVFSVLPDIQGWVNGQANYGWVLPGWPDGTGRTVFSPSESTNSEARPHLIVKWVPAGTPSVSFQDGVNGYSGEFDTSLRQGTPDVPRGTNNALFVDAEVTPPLNDPEIPLLAFGNIVGSNPGQIPPGATIQIAVLDLNSTVGNGMGDGGTAHAMLMPWTDADTWNTLGPITADGIKAAVNPTFVAGNLNLTPDVQGAALTFDVTPDVQAWDNNTMPNYGWALLPWPAGGNGWGWNSAEATVTNTRPQLRVYYTGGTIVVNIQITGITGAPSAPTLHFTGAANSSFTVYRSATVNGTYTSIGTANSAGDGTGSFTDSSPLPGAAFYKISSP